VKTAAAPQTPNAKAAETAFTATAKGEQPLGAAPAARSGSGEGAGLTNSQPSAPLTGSASAPTATQSTSFAETPANARPAPTANPAEQIALQVRRAQVAGQEQINIKLHPAELGRIEVKLESNNDGTLRAVISAERSETLDLLQRDSRGLERALQDVGVKTDSGSLSFNLRGQGQNQGQMAQDQGATGQNGRGDGKQAESEAALPPQQHRSSHSGALDIQV
jgi:flagellar hook-length control protein FliK